MNIRKYKDFSAGAGGSILSAVCLVLAFPKTDIWPLAWIGLVPLLRSLKGQSPSRAFAQGYWCGFLFFAGTLYWFIHVTVLGAVLLIAYLSVYFGLFALAYYWFSRFPSAWKVFGIASAWTVLEFIRAHFLTGFGWASLGQSQYKNLVVIQIADITGMYGVSFLVVLMNCFLKEWMEKPRAGKRKLFLPTATAALICLTVIVYGVFRYKSQRDSTGPAPTISVAVVQANTPQEMKWEEAAWPDILAQYKVLTAEAAKRNPDLIIWPETSYPGILWEDREVFDELKDFVARLGVPLLLGSVVHEGEDYYNTAMLLSGSGEIVGQYRKIHLVPFGEYIPLRSLFPFLSQIVPIADFTAGKEYTVFQVPSPAGKAAERTPFSVLICFEDTVEGLSREFVRQGARWLVNITNDAWFQDTKAPFMHVQASVFRTVENRRSLVRAANTGVSGLIDSSGRIVGAVEDERGKKTYVSGYLVADVRMSEGETFYTKYGDVFTFGCFGCILGVLIYNKRKEKKDYAG